LITVKLKNLSLDKKEFTEMMQAVRDTEKLLGKVDYSMTEKKKNCCQLQVKLERYLMRSSYRYHLDP